MLLRLKQDSLPKIFSHYQRPEIVCVEITWETPDGLTFAQDSILWGRN